MANEATASGTLTFNGLGLSVTLNQSSSIDLTEIEYQSGTQSVGTADEVIPLGDVAAPGYLFIKNNDATNFVLLGMDGTDYPIKIPAGKSAGPMLWNGAAVHVKADTAACLIAYLLTGI